MARVKVAVALSGGVDSAVAAALLKEQGYQVAGLTMHLYASGSKPAIDAARNITAKLGIPHYVLSLSDEFEQSVISPFCYEYRQGRTPNPCVICNRNLKFGLLLDYARKSGAKYLATGHYAQIEKGEKGYRLLKSRDNFKDQSYFLYTLNQEKLSQCLFPVGHLEKGEVTRLAEYFKLPVSTNSESQDICFLKDRDYRKFLKQRLAPNPGPILNQAREWIANHEGIYNYTIGQRHGLNLGGPDKLYVIRLDYPGNTVVVGPESELLYRHLKASGLSWISGSFPAEKENITAKIRCRAPEIKVQITQQDSYADVYFSRTVKSVAPGQSIVFYCGDEVLGGGIIQD